MSQIWYMIRLNIMKDFNDEFNKYQGTLMAMCYRMLGSFIEAEDIIQEVAIEWIKVDKSELKNHKAWLIRVCTNKAIDYLRRAYRSREVYTGTWLPEILPDSMITWEDHLDKKESLEVPFLLLLENLNPKERAVYILREVFDYSSIEVSNILEISDTNSRKIFQRAKSKINKLENSFSSKNSINSLDTLRRFFESAQNGDKESLMKFLSNDSEFWSDGGGKASASRKVLYQPDAISRFFASIFKNLNNYKYEYLSVNNKPGVILSSPLENGTWKMETVFTVDIVDDEIVHLYAQRNPDKLSFVSKLLDKMKVK